MKGIKTCCFTGHRPQKLGYSENSLQCDELKERLKRVIASLIQNQGVTHFISGMALGVDLYAARIVLDLKAIYPHITLECALPCESQAEKWSERDRDNYFEIISNCDRETMLQHRYTPDCMRKRNEYMVDHSDYVIAVWNGEIGGTCNTVRYAARKQKTVVRIHPQTLEVTKS